ncbi:unnamed protein product, partial [Ectocarpus fasciculatus]
MGWLKHSPNESCCKETGHTASTMGWLNSPSNQSFFKLAGHATSTMGWLNSPSNDSCCREAGHSTPATAWLKQNPNDSCCRETGHTTSAMGWLNSSPNDSCCREAGHDAVLTGIFGQNTILVSLWSQTIHPRLAAEECSLARRYFDPDRNSMAELCSRTSIGSAHVTPEACTAGTRLETQTSRRRLLAVACELRGDHKLRGVCRLTRTCKVGIRLHAPQNSSDTSCNSSVDAYQRFSPPSQAWFKATMKASKHSLLP